MTTVDGELFENLEQAVEFVRDCGGGIVYSQVAGTMYADSLTRGNSNVRIERQRPEGG